jgi:hypothetical protein
VTGPGESATYEALNLCSGVSAFRSASPHLGRPVVARATKSAWIPIKTMRLSIIFAICINCGSSKSQPIQKCLVCGFTPRSSGEKAKSIILSLEYEIDGEYRGKTTEELVQIGQQIRRGMHVFDPSEVSEVKQYAQRVLANSPIILKDLLRWIGVPLSVLLLLLALLWATRWA